MAIKKSETTMNVTNKKIITDTIDEMLQENPNLTMPEFLGKLVDNNISFTADGFKDSGFGIRYRVNGETERASKIGDEFTAAGLQKRGVEYDKNRDRSEITELAQKSMKEAVGDRPVAPADKQLVTADQQEVEGSAQLDQSSQPLALGQEEEEPQLNQASADNEYAESVFAELAGALQKEPQLVGQEDELGIAEVPLIDRSVVAEKEGSIEPPLEQLLIDGNSEYVEQVFTDLTDTLGGEQGKVSSVQEEEPLLKPLALGQDEEEPQLNQVSADNEYAESVFADLADALQKEPEPVRQEEEPKVVQPEEEIETTSSINQGEEEPELVAPGVEEAEAPAAVIQKEEESEKIVENREAEPATLREKSPVTVEQSAIDAVNFMLDLLQADKFHPTSKIAEADRYSFSRSEDGGVQINDTYNKGRVVFQADKDNNVKVSNFQSDEKTKFTALFERLQKDEKTLTAIRPNSNSKSSNELQSTNQDIPQPSQPDVAKILEPPVKADFKAIYEPIRLTFGRIQDWTKDAYLTIENPQKRQEVVNMLGGYREKINDSIGSIGTDNDPIVLSEEDFQAISTLERNSHDLRSTRDGVVTRDQAINDNPQVRADLGLASQPKPQAQKPVTAQSQR